MPRHKDLPDAGSVRAKKTRQRFGRHEDYLLIRQVQTDTPYNARHGAIGDTWDTVAARLNDHPDFRMRPIKGTTAKTRFDTLLHRHRKGIKSDKRDVLNEKEAPFRKIMTDLVQHLEFRMKGNARLDDDVNNADHDDKKTRVGKCRQNDGSKKTFEIEASGRRDSGVVPRAMGTEQMDISPDVSFRAAQVSLNVAEPIDEPTLLQGPVAEDVVTVQQAMAELLKMQHAFATRPYPANVDELEKINEVRLREEEEKTKQRGLELQIEMQRTKRRQLELDFEKEERKKDREAQAKLIASLVERLEPKRD